MKLQKLSLISGKVHTLELPITEQQLFDYESGKLGLIQNAFPHLDDDQREFIMTGITHEEWDELFKEEE